MEKNDFLAINELIYQIYTIPDGTLLKGRFLTNLRRIIGYSYASIMMINDIDGQISVTEPYCVPNDFTRFEAEYNKYEGIDHTDWILSSPESVIIRESEIMPDAKRLTSPIYSKYYSKFNIYDTMQMSIVYAQKPIAVLTLYRTRADGAFTDNDLFYLRAFSSHLNYAFNAIYTKKKECPHTSSAAGLALQFGLTKRESEVLDLIFCDKDNYEISDTLEITIHTLQKHLQNIYRKANVSGRIELMKYR